MLGLPHGGNYLVQNNFPAKEHEIAIVDDYYSWGEDDCNAPDKVRTMPAPKLVGIKRAKEKNSKNRILWATTSSPRYLLHQDVFARNFLNYLQWHVRFLKIFPDKLLPDLLVRPHQEDLEWGIVSRMQEIVPDLKIDTWDTSFRKRLEESRLYVCDHLSTSYIEALSANNPTILFWDPLLYKLTPKAVKYFEELHLCGILHYSPESAVKTIEEVYLDVETWWAAPVRQESVSKFRNQFCKTGANAVDLWTKEIKRVLRER